MENISATGGCPFGSIDKNNIVQSTNFRYLNHLMRINRRDPAANTGTVTPPDTEIDSEHFEPWFFPDDELGKAVEIRKHIYQSDPDKVLRTKNNNPSIRTVSTLLLNLQAKDLAHRFPDFYEYEDGISVTNKVSNDTYSLQPGDNDLHPLAISGLLSQEDICIVREMNDGRQMFVAGFLATPTKWQLSMFLDKDMDGIHVDVKDYEKKLKKAVDTMMANLPEYPKRQIVRNNLFLYTDPELALFPTDRPELVAENVTDAGSQIFLRTERETLTRLPALPEHKNTNRYTIFTIEPRIFSLDTLVMNMRREKREKLAEAIRTNRVLGRKTLLAEKALNYLTAS